MMMKKKTYTGWSTRGRAFTPKEYASSFLKKNTGDSYSKYLTEFARQYKSKTSRKYLLK